MDNIICPHCNKAFKIDQKGYADILKQVYDKEFERKLDERLIFAEKEKKMEMNQVKKEAEIKIFNIQALKEKEIDELKFNMKEAENSKKHAKRFRFPVPRKRTTLQPNARLDFSVPFKCRKLRLRTAFLMLSKL